MSGAPKVRAMQIIDELETVRRGPYAGAIGYLSYGGDLDTCICIRTVIVKDGVAHVQAGAGIVADSVPAKEYAETQEQGRGPAARHRPRPRAVRRRRHAMTTTAPRAGDGARVFMIDNYDSFTYNLVQFLGELGADITVKRNDQVTIAEIEAAGPTHLVVSPGPCTPNEAGISMDAIAHFGAARLPVLGVCLGHQAIGQVYGGVVRARRRAGARQDRPDPPRRRRRVRRPARPVHGHPLPLAGRRRGAARTASRSPPGTHEGVVMGVSHRELPVHGVQFHPESVLTEVGLDLLATFLRMTGAERGVGGGAAQAAAARRGGRDAE